MSRSDNPIDGVRWVNRGLLTANGYNPNSQVKQNHDLLVESLRVDGWTQAILVRPLRDGKHVIIDGEHRWKASARLDSALVPVVVLKADESGCIAATVRHNRARGSHGVEEMAKLVAALRADGQESGAIEQALGMSADERGRLEQSEGVFLAIMGGQDKTEQ